jgi:hypothetical protein
MVYLIANATTSRRRRITCRSASALSRGTSRGFGAAITIDRLIEEDDRVVATGGGSVAEEGGKSREFVFCEVFSFTGNAVSRLDTYHVWLT